MEHEADVSRGAGNGGDGCGWEWSGRDRCWDPWGGVQGALSNVSGRAIWEMPSGCRESGIAGVELLVAGDIIRTVAIAPTMQNVGVLGVIVLIRTFLSFSLEMEVNGRWPWQPGGKSGVNR